MKKIIAVDKRLKKLKEDLSVKGYEVIDICEQGIAVDVCIYYEHITDFQNTAQGPGAKVLMIGGKNKDTDYVEYVIGKGTYSALF